MTLGRTIRALLATAALLLALPAAAGAARDLYVTNGAAANSVSIFNVAAGAPADPPTAVTTPVAETSTDPRGVAMTPNGANLYVGSAGGSAIVPHAVAANGALTVGAPVAAGSSPAGITVTPGGGFLYVANSGDDTISGYAVGSGGSLTELAPSPFPTGLTPLGIASTPDGQNLYVTNGDGANVSAYDVAADGSLTELAASPYAAGTDPRGISITPDGRFLYVANNGSDDVSAYAVAADGSLTPVAGSPFGTAQGPFGSAITTDGEHLLLSAATLTGTAVSLNIGTNGALSGQTTALAGQAPRTVAVHPNGTNAYVTADTPNQLFTYTVGASGVLTPLGTPQALPNGDQQFQDAVVTPNQGPVAAFSQGTTPASVVATFNANASSDDTGVVSYRWDFGDGTTQTTSLPTVSHKYATNGTYQVTLRVTDTEGCSTTRIYTGQTVLCNGGPAAQVTKQIDTNAPPQPDNRVKKPSLTMRASQAQRRKQIKIRAKVGAGEAARIKLRGHIKQSKVRVKLKKQTVDVKGTNRRRVTLKVKSKHAVKKVRRLIRKAGAVRATVIANFKDDAGNKARLSEKTALTFKKKKR